MATTAGCRNRSFRERRTRGHRPVLCWTGDGDAPASARGDVREPSCGLRVRQAERAGRPQQLARTDRLRNRRLLRARLCEGEATAYGCRGRLHARPGRSGGRMDAGARRARRTRASATSTCRTCITTGWYASATWLVTGEDKEDFNNPRRFAVRWRHRRRRDWRRATKSFGFESVDKTGPAFRNPRAEHILPNSDDVLDVRRQLVSESLGARDRQRHPRRVRRRAANAAARNDDVLVGRRPPADGFLRGMYMKPTCSSHRRRAVSPASSAWH